MKALLGCLLLLSTVHACGNMPSQKKYSHYIFEQGMNHEIGCSLINSRLNNRFTERKKTLDGEAFYISRLPNTSCVIGFTVGETIISPLKCSRLLPSDADKRNYSSGKGRDIQPPWDGEINGVILRWHFVSDPSACQANFSGH